MYSSYENLVESLILNGIHPPKIEDFEPISQSDLSKNLFNVESFIDNLRKSSAEKNKNFAENSNRINAYDIAHSCVRTGIFRVLNYPVKSYASNWLPIVLRGLMGTAAHEFLQDVSEQFTEKEVYLRIPSRKISVKIDCLINQDVLVEVKTCPYAEYEKIIKSNHARINDFKQALLYKYLLENFIEESKQQALPKNKYFLPKYDSYNIKTVQMIYICNDLFSSESDLDTAVNFAKNLRKKLNSRFNYMWFIKVINYNLDKCNPDIIINQLKDKLDVMNDFLDKKIIPPMSNKYIDKKGCFFCLYKDACSKNP